MLFQEHRKYRHASFRPSYALHERRRHFFLFTSNWHPYLSQTFGLSLNLAAQVAPRHSLFLQTQVIFFLHLFSLRILSQRGYFERSGGRSVGLDDGLVDGISLGTALDEGFIDGASLGFIDGTPLGIELGSKLGLDEGFIDGASLGFID